MHLEEAVAGNMIFSAPATIEVWHFWRIARICNSAWLACDQGNKRRIIAWSKEPQRFYRARSYMAPYFIEAWAAYISYIPLIKLMKA